MDHCETHVSGAVHHKMDEISNYELQSGTQSEKGDGGRCFSAAQGSPVLSNLTPSPSCFTTVFEIFHGSWKWKKLHLSQNRCPRTFRLPARKLRASIEGFRARCAMASSPSSLLNLMDHLERIIGARIRPRCELLVSYNAAIEAVSDDRQAPSV